MSVPNGQKHHQHQRNDDCICRKSRDADNVKDVIPTTRVYKKSSPSGKLTCYIGYREVFSDLVGGSGASDDDGTDFLEGAILLNTNDDTSVYTIYLNLQATLRFGIPTKSPQKRSQQHPNHHHHHHFQSSITLYTQNKRLSARQSGGGIDCSNDSSTSLTLLQQRLLRKLGPNARPFLFKLSKSSPFSSQLVLKRRPLHKGSNAAAAAAVAATINTIPTTTAIIATRCVAVVDYELRVSMIAEGSFATILPSPDPSIVFLHDLDNILNCGANKRNTLRLSIRKLAIATVAKPNPPGYLRLPSVDIRKHFFFSHAPLNVECTLDKSVVYHDERAINVNVNIGNNSNRTVKSITIELIQYSQVFLPSSPYFNQKRPSRSNAPPGSSMRTCNVVASTSRFKSCVSRLTDSTNGFPISPCMTFSRVYSLPFGCCQAINDLGVMDGSSNVLRNVLVLDGPPNSTATCLAASTQLMAAAPTSLTNVFEDAWAMTKKYDSGVSLRDGPYTGASGGIAVKYKVRVRLSVSMSNDVTLVLPVHIAHRPARRLLATCPVHHKHNISNEIASSFSSTNASADASRLKDSMQVLAADDEDDLIKFESDDEDDSPSGSDDVHEPNNDDNDDNSVQSLETFARLRINGH